MNHTASSPVGICFGAVSEARTRDPQLGKLMLYQLSYYRVCIAKLDIICQLSKFYQFFLLNLRCLHFPYIDAERKLASKAPDIEKIILAIPLAHQ